MALRLADAFLVRTPLLPAQTITGPLSHPSLPSDTVLRWVADPVVQEAIFLASPALYDETRRWLAGTLTNADDISHVERSLLKYMIRMSIRATPFGLFACCSTGSFGETASGQLAGRDAIRTTTRLDMNLVCQLAQQLSTSPDVRPALRFYPNTTLYVLGRAIRYFEFWYDDKRGRHYRLVSIEQNRYLEQAIDEARTGARLDEIASRIADTDVSVEEALRYLNDLADNQVLTSELEPALTDPELLGALIDRLPPTGHGARAALMEIKASLGTLDNAPCNTVDAYRAIAASIDVIVPNAARDALFQVDSFRPGTLTLPDSVRAQLIESLDILNRLSPSVPLERLERFRTAFRERFEDRQVPLLLAMDAEVGVPYGSQTAAVAPLLDGLDLKPRAAERDDREPPPTPAERLLLPLIWDAIQQNRDEVSLDAMSLETLPLRIDDLPPTMSLVFWVISSGEHCRLLLQGAGGATAAAALGRFAHLDGQILQHVAAIVAHEESACDGSALADLLHLPDDRVGNVLLHPRFRRFEIPCLARSTAPPHDIVRLDELHLSVPYAGPIRLWSSRLGREVMPLLSHAHRYDAEELLPVYRLLGDLQAQGARRAIGIPVARLARSVPRLPRIVYRDCVLSSARWLLNDSMIRDAMACLRSGAAGTAGWRTRHRLPQRVRLSQDDHELFVDLGNHECRELLAAELRGKKEAVLVEDLFDDAHPWITASDGGYRHEVIATLIRPRAQPQS